MTPWKEVTKPIPNSQGTELISSLEGVSKGKKWAYYNYQNHINWI